MINWNDIKQNYNGFRTFGDVHGEYDQLETILAAALRDNLFLIGLGDYTDRGPKSPDVMRRVLGLVREGKMISIVGNHDDKLWRWLNGNNIKIGEALGSTVDQLDTAKDKNQLKDEWHKVMPSWPVWFTVDSYTFVHGGFHNLMITNPFVSYEKKNEFKKIFAMAIYGQVVGFDENNYPVRSHSWVDTIPPEHTVFVGHEVVSRDEPIVETGINNGTAFFMDTGAGKEGKISYKDVYFNV